MRQDPDNVGGVDIKEFELENAVKSEELLEVEEMEEKFGIPDWVKGQLEEDQQFVEDLQKTFNLSGSLDLNEFADGESEAEMDGASVQEQPEMMEAATSKSWGKIATAVSGLSQAEGDVGGSGAVSKKPSSPLKSALSRGTSMAAKQGLRLKFKGGDDDQGMPTEDTQGQAPDGSAPGEGSQASQYQQPGDQQGPDQQGALRQGAGSPDPQGARPGPATSGDGSGGAGDGEGGEPLGRASSVLSEDGSKTSSQGDSRPSSRGGSRPSSRGSTGTGLAPSVSIPNTNSWMAAELEPEAPHRDLSPPKTHIPPSQLFQARPARQTVWRNMPTASEGLPVLVIPNNKPRVPSPPRPLSPPKLPPIARSSPSPTPA